MLNLTEFLQSVQQFPTVIFTVLLGVVFIYWIFVIIGAVDLDLFDIDFDVGDGVDVDGDLDADVTGHGSFSDLLQRLDITGIPLTVTLSILVLASWLLTYSAVQIMSPAATTFLWGSVIAFASFCVATLITSGLIQPLKKLFVTQVALSKNSLVGKVCEIQTLSVDQGHGQAEIRDDGLSLMIQVRSSDAAHLTRGSKALIFSYDEESDIFQVKPLEIDSSLGV